MFGRFDAILIGKITKDAQLKTDKSGKSYCNFTVAVNRRASTDPKTGERMEPKPMFIEVVAFGPSAESIAKAAVRGATFSGRVDYTERENTVVKDGVTTVYHNVNWRVAPGGWDIEPPREKKEWAGSKGSSGAPEPSNDGDDDMPEGFSQPTSMNGSYEDELTSELPF